MELLYLWINQYKGLKEVDVNLSNQFRFHYNTKQKVLEVKVVENFIQGFFGKNITNFTGIIGENGAGKTTILRYIIEYCSGGIHNNDDDQAIIIVKINEKLQYYSFLDFKFKAPDRFAAITRINDLEEIKTAATTVFLSNTFDPTSYYATDYSKQQLGDTKNLSTWHLLYSDYQNRTGKDAADPSLSYNDKVSAFSSQELIRMVRLLRWLNKKENESLNNSNSKIFPVVPPPFLNLALYFDREQGNNRILSELAQSLNDYFRLNRSRKNRFILRAFQASVFHFVGEAKFVSGSDNIRNIYQLFPEKILEYLRNKEKYENISNESIVPELHDIFYYVLRTHEFEYLNDRISQIQTFIHKLGEFVFKRNIILHDTGNILSVELTKANKATLEELIEDYYKVDRISGFADFYFSHQPAKESTLSSGEYAMLIVFARLNDMKLERRDRKRPLLMLIDEAELALHPQWQKEFIFHFTDFIVERFGKHKVQVVLTSHSPFILSDLPPNCVILIKRGSGKSVVVDGLDKRNETFGANIHELFTDSFFLQDSLIGEFARIKIEGLVQRVNSKEEFSLAEYNSLKKEIDIIGEPYVRFKLLEKILKGVPREQFDNIIIERERELDLIRNIRNDKNRG